MRDYISASKVQASAVLEAELIGLGFDNYRYKRIEEKPTGNVRHNVQVRVYLDDPRIQAVLDLVNKHRMTYVYATEFTKEDMDNADWYEAEAVSWLGYPKPEKAWLENTYDLDDPIYCPECRSGLKQKAPFHLSSLQPKAKASSFFSPGWVFDEIFIRKEVQKILQSQRITGASYLYPIKANTGTTFDNLVQLVVEHFLPKAFQIEKDSMLRVCEVCRRSKFKTNSTVKKFESQAFEGQPDIIKTTEFFGNGHLILISHKFAKLIFQHRWNGLRLKPIVLVDA